MNAFVLDNHHLSNLFHYSQFYKTYLILLLTFFKYPIELLSKHLFSSLCQLQIFYKFYGLFNGSKMIQNIQELI